MIKCINSECPNKNRCLAFTEKSELKSGTFVNFSFVILEGKIYCDFFTENPMKQRQVEYLKGGHVTERYLEEIEGHCKCGHQVKKVVGSSIATFKNGLLRYTDDNTSSGIFRCRECSSVIDENWIPNPHFHDQKAG